MVIIDVVYNSHRHGTLEKEKNKKIKTIHCLIFYYTFYISIEINESW